MRVALLALMLLCAMPAEAGWKKRWLISLGTLAAANTLDILSSRGLPEYNPLMRNADGRFNVRKGIAVKLVASGGFVLLQRLVAKSEPDYKVFAYTNFAASGVLVAASVRNYNIRGERNER
jgi:hypothetical protein